MKTRSISTKEGKIFRRRFRLPFEIFDKVLVPLCKEHNIFDNVGEDQIPIEIKILMCLRILGRNAICDDIKEFNGDCIGESTINDIFKKFVTNFAKRIYPKIVKLPTDEKLQSIMRIYEKLGLPGCLGSMDITHVDWGRCPSFLRRLCTGKEKHPTLGN